MKKKISNVLNKDVKEFNKVYLSLIGIAILLLAVFTSINLTKNSYALFSDTIKGEKTIEVEVNNLLNKTTVFSYTGDVQEYTIPRTGYYYIEMAGAEGGANVLGAKTSGYIYLDKGEILYFYVGEQGENGNTNCRTSGYQFNGGGISKPAKAGVCASTGGGATDVRLVSGDWDNTSSLISRIMVAGAGGGAAGADTYTKGYGGTLYGGDPIFSTYQSNLGNGATQTSGGAAPTMVSGAQSNGTAGSFGKGGYGGASGTSASTGGGAGGGSGYYGGSGASGLSNGSWPGGGGSSYISGYAGVNSVLESTTITHTNGTLHYSGKYFIGGKMLEGQNEGNGYAKITYVGTKPEKKTTKLDNVRYIKNCTSYNTANSANHWIEVQAIKDGVNIAKGKSVTGTTAQHSSYPYSRVTDGDITYTNYAATSSNSTNQCITVDLGDTYDLDEVAVWNYFGNPRSYYDNITSVSSNNSSWTEVIDEAMLETSNGHRINAYTDIYNGYVQDGLVLWYDGYANTGTTRNHTTTTFKDLSGTGNNGTLVGGTWYDKYLLFDGTNDWVRMTQMNYATPTLEIVLLYPQIPSYNAQVLSNIETGGNSIKVIGGSGIVDADYYIASAYRGIKEKTALGVNTIGSYSSSYDRHSMKFYKKGLLENEISYPGSIGYPGSSTVMTLGTNPKGTASQGEYFKGNIYSVRIYNRALTDEEVLHNYMYDKENFNLDN